MKKGISNVVAMTTLALTTMGCGTLAQTMPDSTLGQAAARSASATDAKPPADRTEFAEAQPLLDRAAKAFAAPRKGRPLRTYLTKGQWTEKVGVERNVPAVIFTNEQARGVAKSEEGESGVCYEYSCSMVQKRLADKSWSDPGLDCNEVPVKVTCKSASSLP